MKYAKLLLILFLLPFVLPAQKSPFSYGSFVIKGHVKNYAQPTFDFEMTSFVSSTSHSVVVKEDGSFSQAFPIQCRQDVCLYVNKEALTFPISDSDTIYLEWDDKDFSNTFSVKGKNTERSAELAKEFALLKQFRQPALDMMQRLGEHDKDYDDEKKFTIINDMFNEHMQVAWDSIKRAVYSRYATVAIYFTYAGYMRQKNLIPRFSPVLKKELDEQLKASRGYSLSGLYTQLNEDWFYNVPSYRDFIFEYIRFVKPFNSYTGSPVSFNPTLDEYHLAYASIPYVPVRDWFITNTVMEGFEFYPFEGVEAVYKQFAGNCSTAYFKNKLTLYYNAIRRLKPGSIAPAFSLKDVNGKMVSLNSFRGKVVYLDFWGVGCGPCIYDIKNNLPDVHKKYKDRGVVFISICVDADEKSWKAALAKYKMEGVQLLAEGWTNNPVCKDYNISGIPHYVLIDKSGKIKDNKGPEPYELKGTDEDDNVIDELLR